MDAGGRELEADLPFAGDAAAVYFGGVEFPAARGFEAEVGEILTRAGVGEIGFSDIAGRIYVGEDGDAYSTGNRSQCFFGSVGQDLVENFAFA